MLLDTERITYEQVHGRVSSGEQLVINHEQFAWLHRISELVVQIDEMLKQMNQYRWTMSKSDCLCSHAAHAVRVGNAFEKVLQLSSVNLVLCWHTQRYQSFCVQSIGEVKDMCTASYLCSAYTS